MGKYQNTAPRPVKDFNDEMGTTIITTTSTKLHSNAPVRLVLVRSCVLFESQRMRYSGSCRSGREELCASARVVVCGLLVPLDDALARLLERAMSRNAHDGVNELVG